DPRFERAHRRTFGEIPRLRRRAGTWRRVTIVAEVHRALRVHRQVAADDRGELSVRHYVVRVKRRARVGIEAHVVRRLATFGRDEKEVSDGRQRIRIEERKGNVEWGARA